ncbi:DUF493 family protein [Tenacibaculum sp. C7A-26P2]|uniref:DUF493 family protein n=1 Tax=Tenacibaculum sp. C7A-26P2 TaxID=3447504 RepID=UPI003F861038
MADREEFYKKLKAQLDDTTEFPSNYLYKFIVPTTQNQLAEVQDLFNDGGAVISTKKSRTGKYISVSVQIKLNTSDEVIQYYKKAENIEGIISL